MKKFITNKYVLYALGIIFTFFLWWGLSALFDIGGMIFPSPIETIVEAGRLLGLKYTYICMLHSLKRMLIGFSLGFIAAFILGLLVNNSESRYQFFSPLITVLKAVPTVVVAFLFVIISGAADAPIFVVFLIAFPILYEAIVQGLKSTDEFVISSARVDGANKLAEVFRIRLPLAVPHIILGIISSFSLSFKVEIMAEVISGYTKNGIGSLIKGVQMSDPTNMVPIFAYSLIAIIFILLINFVSNILRKRFEIAK